MSYRQIAGYNALEKGDRAAVSLAFKNSKIYPCLGIHLAFPGDPPYAQLPGVPILDYTDTRAKFLSNLFKALRCPAIAHNPDNIRGIAAPHSIPMSRDEYFAWCNDTTDGEKVTRIPMLASGILSWTDGSYSRSTSEGGYGTLMFSHSRNASTDRTATNRGKVTAVSAYGSKESTTNIRAEAMAILRVLVETLSHEEYDYVTICTDSKFWCDMMLKYIPRWSKQKMLQQRNNDLVEAMYGSIVELKRRGIQVKFVFVPSHDKNGWSVSEPTSHRGIATSMNMLADDIADAGVKVETSRRSVMKYRHIQGGTMPDECEEDSWELPEFDPFAERAEFNSVDTDDESD